jgi:superfamily II DNA or RNA helicase
MPDTPITHLSAPAAKIGLFRSLFHGRDDVYPRRFESRKTGRAGYAPACANEWVRGLCDKRRVHCANCPNRRFLPVTDAALHHHLAGQDESGREFVMGVYPMLPDETCFFLAMDFDRDMWREDILAVAETCREQHLPYALERSRSGNGAHLWLFFVDAIPAVLARKLGAHILTETMEHRPDIGLESYDRFFPNQDTLPKGGFGNLIALPLQKRPREQGFSVFLDDRLEPYPDPWAFLSTLSRLTRGQVEQRVQAAEARGRVLGVRFALTDEDDVEPWTAPPSRQRPDPPIPDPLPASLDLVLADEIYIPKAGMPPALCNRLIRLAAFQNPAFYQAQAMRLSTHGTPRVIACAEDHPQHIALPRGCLQDVRDLLADLGIAVEIRDERHAGTPLPLAFHGVLRPDQQAAADVLAAHDNGILAAATAFGKTVVAAWLIAKRGVNTLVLVHRQQLLEQWVERLSAFLDLPTRAIGRIGGGRRSFTGTLDVALIQSLVRKGVVDDRIAAYGHLIVDECHHLPAVSFEQVVRRARARYVLGLSATVARKDGHHPILFMQCGPIRHRGHASHQPDARPLTRTVWVRPTAFRPPDTLCPDIRRQFHDLVGILVSDEKRNRLIADDILAAIQDGRSPLVLTERTEHLAALHALLAPAVRYLFMLQGGLGRKHLRAILSQLAAVPENEPRVLLATGRYIGEGFDDPRLDTLFLALPVSWRGTVAQYAGRLHRQHERKHDVRIYDYADLNAPLLARMFDRRCQGYEAIGYTILLPASAVPGWPPEVPLPVESEWKQTYAASVQRLIRDGVDTELGNLFVHAARSSRPSGRHEEGCARSATEAFLFRRLETLADTAGRFQINAVLPIPFDAGGHMEVDFLARDARVAIELDGPQHLNNPDAYRRDRRKDVLLQENGYRVLRFLAEDVSLRLNDVLDSIVHALAPRRQETP